MERYTMRLPDDLGAVPVSGYGTPEIIDRLAAYEDTGLEPDICAEYKKFEDEAVSKNVPFSRIVELMAAEAEGHLLVLPCKVGGQSLPDRWHQDL